MIYYPLPYAYSVSIGLYIRTGSRFESENNNGLTHVLEHMHFRHLQTMDQDELYYKMECIGCVPGGATYKDTMRFYIKVRPQYVFDGLSFFIDILKTDTWPQEALNLEKKVILNELLEKKAIATKRPFIDQVVWKGHPLSNQILGKEENVKNFSVDDLIKHKKEYFVSNNMVLVLTGKLSEETIIEINDDFGKVYLEHGERKKAHIVAPNQFRRKPDVMFLDCPWDMLDVAISFDIDLRIISNEEIYMLNAVLAGGDGSLLPRLIREKLGLTYDIDSIAEIYEDAACVHIEYAVEKKKLYVSLVSIASVLKEIKHSIDQRELDRNMNFFSENFWYTLEDPSELNLQLGFNAMESTNWFDIHKKSEIYGLINKQRLSLVAKTIFVPNNASITVLGSVSKITKKEIRRIIKEGLS